MFNTALFNQQRFNTILPKQEVSIKAELKNEAFMQAIVSESLGPITLTASTKTTLDNKRVVPLHTGQTTDLSKSALKLYNRSRFNRAQQGTRVYRGPLLAASTLNVSRTIEVANKCLARGNSFLTLQKVERTIAMKGNFSADTLVQAPPTMVRTVRLNAKGNSFMEVNSSQLVSERIYEDYRVMQPEITIHFPGIGPKTFRHEDIYSFHILEEFDNTNDSLLAVGGISAKEFEVILDNVDRDFDLDNTSSPYYGLLKPELKVEVNLVVYDFTGADGIAIPLGIYYTGIFNPLDTDQVSLTCYDKLYFKSKQPIQGIPIQENRTYKELFKIILDQISHPYLLSSNLTVPIPLSGLPQTTVHEGLSTVAQASRTNIIVRRDDKIDVRYVNPTGISSKELTDENMITKLTVPTILNNIFAGANIALAKPVISDKMEILKLSKEKLVVGENTLSGIAFVKQPVVQIAQIEILYGDGVTLKDCSATPWELSLVLDNTGGDQEVDIIVYGHIVEPSYLDQTKMNPKADVNDKVLTIKNVLIQNAPHAEAYSDLVCKWAGDNKRLIKIHTRGEPQITIGDIILVTEKKHRLDKVPIYVTKNEIDYDGGLSSYIEGIRL